MSEPITGLDIRGPRQLRARVAFAEARPRVEVLDAVPGDTSSRADDVASLMIAVPDSEVVVKHLKSAGGAAARERDRLAFELLQTQLEDESEFLLDIATAGRDTARLGFIFRRDRLARLIERFGLTGLALSEETAPVRMPFRMRARALGLGYLRFCERDDGAVVGLIDLAPAAASVCIIHERAVVDVAHLSLHNRDLTSDRDWEQLAVDLKTVINFRLAGLLERGIRTPLARLVVVGEAVDGSRRRVIERYFPVGVTAPRFHRGYISDSVGADPDIWPLFLAALGLTVE